MNDFVNVLSDLIREATLGEIAEAIKSATVHAPARRIGALARTTSARDGRGVAGHTPGYQAKAPIAASTGGQQRTPELLAQLMGRVHSHINAHPGDGVGTIAASLGTSSKELSLLLRKLLDDKKVVSMGKKRGTRYFPR